MDHREIIDLLPYSSPFLFVDELLTVNEQGVEGKYTFRSDLPFFQGHFKNNPITPGAILTECCAQIGLVCLGIYLLGTSFDEQSKIAMTSTEMEFLVPVYPDEEVTIKSSKIYFRFNKLKCKVSMFNEQGKMVCNGIIAGVLKPDDGA